MNRERRKAIAELVDRINEAREMLENLQSEVDEILEEEQEYLDNMPDNLRESDRAYTAEEAIDSLTSASEGLGDMTSSLEDVISSLEEAQN